MSEIPEASPPIARDFAPATSGGGLIAAVGFLLATGAACVTTLPGLPTAGLYPVWALWTLRALPLPALLLLVAVVYESQYRVRTEPAAMHFRRGIAGSVRLPWREVTDYFADCGRSLSDMAASGGSLVHPEADPNPPFAQYGPDYVIISRRGTFAFSDNLTDVGSLAAEVTQQVPPGTPRHWEEATWLGCSGCGERMAISLWPLPFGHSVRYCDRCQVPSVALLGALPPPACACAGSFTQERLVCSTCGEPFAEEALSIPEGLFVERRGAVQRPEVWPPVAVEPPALEEQPVPPVEAEEGEPVGPA